MVLISTPTLDPSRATKGTEGTEGTKEHERSRLDHSCSSFYKSFCAFLWLIVFVAKGATGVLACGGVIDPDFVSIYEHTLNTCRGQLRLFKRGAIDDRVGVEEDQVRFEAGSDQTTITELETLCRQRRHLPDRFGQSEPVLFTNEAPQHTRIRSGAARMTRSDAAVATHHHPRLLVERADV